MEHLDSILTRDVRGLAINQGVSLIGIGTADQFEGAPKGHRPQDIVKGARSVVTFGGTDPLACIKLADSGDGCRVGDSVPRGPLPDYLQNYFNQTDGAGPR
jgi:hypothetical protein